MPVGGGMLARHCAGVQRRRAAFTGAGCCATDRRRRPRHHARGRTGARQSEWLLPALPGECCAEGQACSADDVCSDCATGGGFVSICEANSRYRDLFDCLGRCPGDPCGAVDDPPEPPNDPGAQAGAGGGRDEPAPAAGAAGERTRPRGGAGMGGRSSEDGGAAGSAGTGVQDDEPAERPSGDSGCACRLTPGQRSRLAWWWVSVRRCDGGLATRSASSGSSRPLSQACSLKA